MANILTGLIPSFYRALDTVSRELVGFVNSVTLDAKGAEAAVGQTVTSYETPEATSGSITPGVTPPDTGDQTIGAIPLIISSAEEVRFRWTGEEEQGLNMGGAGASNIQQGQIEQAIRTIVNKMELSVFNAARQAASRAHGTAGTTPFATTLTDAAQIKKILDDNGADGARSLIIDTTAGVNLRGITQLTKANEAGTEMTLRDGELLDLFGLSTKESAAVRATTKGTGAGYLVNSGALAIGSTVIPVDTGTGTILAGDVVTFAGDTNQYVVVSALAGVSFTIGKPGLRVAIADNAAITVSNTFTANVGFSKSAIVLLTRTPAMPKGGDMAREQTIVTDPRSGLSFRLAYYPEYYRGSYSVSAVWGATGVKPAHTAILKG